MPNPPSPSRRVAAPCLVALAAVALLAGAAASCLAAGPGIDVKLAYNIAYDLAPISIDLDGGPDYVIYDTWKHPLAQGSVAGKQTITFKPPKFGWYVVECGTKDGDHFTSGSAKFIGVTPKFPNMHTLAAGESHGGWNDEALQAFAGLFLDRTNTRMGMKHADRVLADCEKYGITLLMQFESKPSPADAKDWASHYKGRIKYWEMVNEPNFSMGPQAYVAMAKEIYPIIHEADPEAIVMGPDCCGVGPFLGWYDGFFKAGGGAFIDALSFHDYEGHGMIDFFHWNTVLTRLTAIMDAHGGKKPLWQTERAIGGAGFFGYGGNSQALRITLQRDILESWGIPNNHNNHYYAAVTGYNGVPTFVMSGSGPHQAALACRTRAAMIKDREFVEKIDFGPSANNMFLGLRYRGPEGQTITLRNLGFLDIPVPVAVSGGTSLEVVDSWGNSEKVPVSGGRAIVTVSQWPCYLRLTSGQDAKVIPWDLGKNIAPEATFSYSGGTKSDSKLLTNGIMEDHFPGSVLGHQWIGGYSGSALDEKPESLEISFEKPRPIQTVVVFGEQADNQFSAILDYDLQAEEGGSWVTVDKVHANCPPTDAVESYISPALVWYETNCCYINQLKAPVTTAKLRIVVRRVTRGLMPDMILENLIDTIHPSKDGHHWHATDEQLHLREIEVFGPTPTGRR